MQALPRLPGAPLHEAINVATGETLYIISDPVHLFKKLRNQLLGSYPAGSGRGKRHLELDGKSATWDHIVTLHKEEAARSTEAAPYQVRRRISRLVSKTCSNCLWVRACPCKGDASSRGACFPYRLVENARRLLLCRHEQRRRGRSRAQATRRRACVVHRGTWACLLRGRHWCASRSATPTPSFPVHVHLASHARSALSLALVPPWPTGRLTCARPASVILRPPPVPQFRERCWDSIVPSPPCLFFGRTQRYGQPLTYCPRLCGHVFFFFSFSFQTYIRKSRRLYSLLHNPKWLRSPDDPLLDGMSEILTWFEDWRAAVERDGTAKGETKAQWAKRFISDKTYTDMNLAVKGMRGLLRDFFTRYGTDDKIMAKYRKDVNPSVPAPLAPSAAAPASGTMTGTRTAAEAPMSAVEDSSHRGGSVDTTAPAPTTPSARRRLPFSEGSADMGSPEVPLPGSPPGSPLESSDHPYVKTGRISQNPLEGFFGLARAASRSGSLSAPQYSSQVAGYRVARAVSAHSMNYGSASPTKADTTVVARKHKVTQPSV